MGAAHAGLAWLVAALALVATVAMLLAAWWLRRDPFALIRLEYARQRRALGATRGEVTLRVHGDASHRVVYAERAARHGAGDVPVVVMVHGYTGSKENWYPVAARLGSGLRLVMPDLPGWGESQRIDGADYGFGAQAARVAALIEVLSPGRPVVLLGHSMGGGIAAVVAARFPARVSHVGLFNAAGVRFADNPFGLAVLAGHNPFGVHDDASLRAYLGILFHDLGVLPPLPWPVRRALIHRRRADAEFEQAVLDRIGRGPEQFLPGELAAQVRQPTLLLWGAQDQVIDASAMDLFAACVPQARRVLLEDCGHMSLTEQPAPIAVAVRALLDKRPSTIADPPQPSHDGAPP